MSTKPGATIRPAASMVSRAASPSSRPTAATRPSLIATSPRNGTRPLPSTMLPSLISMSCIRSSPSGQFQALHSFFAPAPNHGEVLLRLCGVLLTGETRTRLGMTFIVVIAGRALLLKSRVKHRATPDLRDPLRLGLRAWLDRPRLVLLRMLNDIGDVTGLLVERLREVRGNRVLQRAHMKAVGEAMTEKSVQRFHPT